MTANEFDIELSKYHYTKDVVSKGKTQRYAQSHLQVETAKPPRAIHNCLRRMVLNKQLSSQNVE